MGHARRRLCIGSTKLLLGAGAFLLPTPAVKSELVKKFQFIPLYPKICKAMHKKAGNLLSKWALALRRSIGEPAPLPTQLPGVAAACAPVNTAASPPLPPPNTPALSQ